MRADQIDIIFFDIWCVSFWIFKVYKCKVKKWLPTTRNMFWKGLEAFYQRSFLASHVHSRLQELGIYRQCRGKCINHNNRQRKIGVRIKNRITSTSSSFIPVVQKRTVTCLSGVKKVTDVPKMSFASMICRSVNNKAFSVSDAIVESNFDCVALAETWL